MHIHLLRVLGRRVFDLALGSADRFLSAAWPFPGCPATKPDTHSASYKQMHKHSAKNDNARQRHNRRYAAKPRNI